MSHRTASFMVHKGSRKTLNITVTDENESVLDITGGLARWHVARSRYSTAALIIKTSTGGSTEINFIDSTAGRLDIELYRDDTLTISPGVYYHELQVVDSIGSPFQTLEGYVTFEHSKIASST